MFYVYTKIDTYHELIRCISASLSDGIKSSRTMIVKKQAINYDMKNTLKVLTNAMQTSPQSTRLAN